MRTTWWRKARREVRDHPLMWLMLAAGCGVGLLLRLPLLPEIREDGATIIGSAIGAVMAVAGAAYVSTMQTRKDEDTALQLVTLVLVTLERRSQFVFECARRADEANSGGKKLAQIGATFLAVQELAKAVHTADSQLSVLTAMAGRAGPHAAFVAVDAQATLNRHGELLSELCAVATEAPAEKHLYQVYGNGQCEYHYQQRLKPLLSELRALDPYFRNIAAA